MFTAEVKAKFLHETLPLYPIQRMELIIEHLSKASALLDQELVLDSYYGSMDYKTMNNLTKDRYKNAIHFIRRVIEELEK